MRNRLVIGTAAIFLGLLRLITENQAWPLEWIIDVACIVAGAGTIGLHFWGARKISVE